MDRAEIQYIWSGELESGRSIHVTVNRINGLFVADVVAEDGRTGNEIVRVNLNELPLRPEWGTR